MESTIKLLLDRKINSVTNRTISLFFGQKYQTSSEQKLQHSCEQLPRSLCIVAKQWANIFREINDKEFLAMTCDRGITLSDMIR